MFGVASLLGTIASAPRALDHRCGQYGGRPARECWPPLPSMAFTRGRDIATVGGYVPLSTTVCLGDLPAAPLAYGAVMLLLPQPPAARLRGAISARIIVDPICVVHEQVVQ